MGLLIFLEDLVRDGGGGLDHRDARFSLEALLYNFHVKQTEESAAKSEPQGIG